MNFNAITNIQKLLKHVDSTEIKVEPRIHSWRYISVLFMDFYSPFNLKPLFNLTIVFRLVTRDQINLYMMLHKCGSKRQRYLQINATRSDLMHGRMRKMEFGNRGSNNDEFT